MIPMKGFFAPISSPARLHGSYLEALSEITRLSYQQIKAPQSGLPGKIGARKIQIQQRDVHSRSIAWTGRKFLARPWQK